MGDGKVTFPINLNSLGSSLAFKEQRLKCCYAQCHYPSNGRVSWFTGTTHPVNERPYLA
jgi:hypothetical protein